MPMLSLEDLLMPLVPPEALVMPIDLPAGFHCEVKQACAKSVM